MAADRTTHLTAAEIADEALRQFDASPSEPSIRSLAAALNVAPTAIYHHYPARGAIVQAVVEKVWLQAITETLRILPRPDESDPVDVLVATGLGTRRAWLEHHRVARYMASTPEATAFTRTAMTFMVDLFTRLGLGPQDAAIAFHSYSTFMIGACLFAADRRSADELLAADPARGQAAHAAAESREPLDEVRAQIESVMDVSTTDPERDEQLFEAGLRRLVNGLAVPPG